MVQFKTNRKEIVEIEKAIENSGVPKNYEELHYIKSKGFSDKRIAKITKYKNKKNYIFKR